MPSDTEAPIGWWPTGNSDQPLDFSTKTRVPIYPPPPAQHSPKFHHRTNQNTTPDAMPLNFGFCRPIPRSPPPPAPLPINPFNFLDPMLGMNDSFRPGLLGGLPSLPLSLLDTRRPPSKNMRPFKAYPRDPLSLPIGYYGLASSPVDIQQGLLINDDAGYADFRKNVLLGSGVRDEKVERSNEEEKSEQKVDGDDVASSPTTSECPPSSSTSSVASASMNKRKPRTLPDELKDEAYWERRRKNNEAAKRSRDARRAKEDEIAIRAAFLEQENLKLRVEVAALRNETAKLRCMLYNS